jgi:uncharacterized RDD family membrane protein YckC
MNEVMSKSTSTPLYPGLFRRLFAIAYDCILLSAVLFIAAAIVTALNQGEAIKPGNSLYPLFVLVLFVLCYLYFAWFWIHGGQTLGMKTWRMQLRIDNGGESTGRQIDWKIAAIRFAAAILSWGIFGLGFLWALVDKHNRCWHDLISNTVIIDLRQ